MMLDESMNQRKTTQSFGTTMLATLLLNNVNIQNQNPLMGRDQNQTSEDSIAEGLRATHSLRETRLRNEEPLLAIELRAEMGGLLGMGNHQTTTRSSESRNWHMYRK